ncbi:MAG TPA: hypothetical protein VJ654_20825 [Noviherbaspirillum sp.]|nr:hypothetical protein [Noviherbaspirillum sp.]
MTFSGNKVWDGHHNNNAIYYSRAAYNDLTALYVVASMVPAGRSAEEELGNLASQNQRAVDAYPRNFSQGKATGELGPSLTLTVRNAKEGSKSAPFPLARSIDNRPNAPLTSLAVHRLFVHGRDRIELAGLRYFRSPVDVEQEAQATADLSAFVEQAAQSLQACTAKLLARM